jgi:hypothetical protein
VCVCVCGRGVSGRLDISETKWVGVLGLGGGFLFYPSKHESVSRIKCMKHMSPG